MRRSWRRAGGRPPIAKSEGARPDDLQQSDELGAQLLALWQAVRAMSATSALVAGKIIATWALAVPLVLWMQHDLGFWTDRRISVVTFAVDLVIIMVGAQNVRTSELQTAILRRAVDSISRQAEATAGGLGVVREALERMEARYRQSAERMGPIIAELELTMVRVKRLERTYARARAERAARAARLRVAAERWRLKSGHARADG